MPFQAVPPEASECHVPFWNVPVTFVPVITPLSATLSVTVAVKFAYVPALVLFAEMVPIMGGVVSEMVYVITN